MSSTQKLNSLFKRKSIRYGVPFLFLMVGGSFGLEQFSKLRYEFSRKRTVSPQEMEKLGVSMKKSDEVTLDKEYEKIKSLNIDEWENKRGPRPWEETQ
ncbi:cytochrome c oxidase assembly protein COX16 homolog, mitochondrial [Anastrepha obliqua]|uniref:cytochrome c oxidase assembly protein COX16 homolog, mitochondrial n=1 Tax=Anastrepha ludens TaxID=28586 RepID=UPI0023B01C53|nr:cytochrome c oxidase assembly protein COX16 homolog, mitochondrial [Anastrepha ludens]XP_054747121.1 cytochrome c oxidase assembly protein COX16 homolog, mitochondrial [Anastrepha obliqua]